MRCIWFSSCLGGKLKKMELLDWNLSPCHLFPAVSCVCVCAFGNYQERYRGRSGVLGWVYGGVSGLTGFVCLFRWGWLGSDGGEMAILNGKYIRNNLPIYLSLLKHVSILLGSEGGDIAILNVKYTKLFIHLFICLLLRICVSLLFCL